MALVSCIPGLSETETERCFAVNTLLLLILRTSGNVLFKAAIRYLFLLVTVLPQTFFTFVGSHLMTFSLLTAWHRNDFK